MRHLFLGLVLLSAVPLWAALCGIAWPGWQVSTSEVSSSRTYPLTHLLDGDPATAWVYHKAWRDLPPGVAWGYAEDPDARFNHGVDTTLYLEADQSFVCDGIGLINGYAKSSRTYWRNNRITHVTIHAYGPNHTQWNTTVTLRITRAIQRIPVPHLRMQNLTITITAVDPGADDDLCISELVLYRQNTPIPWCLSHTVLSTEMHECDGYPAYTLWCGRRIVTLDGHERTTYTGFMQPHAARVMLLAGQTLYLYDFNFDTYVLSQHFIGKACRLGWISNTQAVLQTEDDRHRVRWYRMDARQLTWQRCPSPSEKDKHKLHYFSDGC